MRSSAIEDDFAILGDLADHGLEFVQGNCPFEAILFKLLGFVVRANQERFRIRFKILVRLLRVNSLDGHVILPLLIGRLLFGFHFHGKWRSQFLEVLMGPGDFGTHIA